MNQSEQIQMGLLHGRHHYGLVAAEYLERWPAGVKTYPVVGGPLAASSDLMPSLIELDRLPTEHRALLMDHLDDAQALRETPLLSALLTCEAPVGQLGAHLAKVQVLRSANDERAWLRVHDPRVLLHLPRVFDEREMSALFGPISQWSVCIDGRWVSIQVPQLASPRLHKSLVTSDQWAALERIGTINRVLACNGWVTHEDLIMRGPAIDELVARGQSRLGLKRSIDLVGYATLGMTLHPRFDESAVARRVIDEHEKDQRSADFVDDSSVVDALQSVAPELWVAAIRELDNERGREEPQ